jgi:UDP-N-acetylglucosamine--N-acetylmuramyl-(pentapeptide) pyrophosphoryl-undecaprenol N-acetylglucosamine transferase
MSGKSAHTLMVMAGGTGGHVFPGLAVADLLRARLERRLDGQSGRAWRRSWCRRAATKWPGCALAPARQGAVAQADAADLAALRLLAGGKARFAACKPDVVLGMGGYISFPGGVMARCRQAAGVHEQNSMAGLANRVLAKIATRVSSAAFRDPAEECHLGRQPGAH